MGFNRSHSLSFSKLRSGILILVSCKPVTLAMYHSQSSILAFQPAYSTRGIKRTWAAVVYGRKEAPPINLRKVCPNVILSLWDTSLSRKANHLISLISLANLSHCVSEQCRFWVCEIAKTEVGLIRFPYSSYAHLILIKACELEKFR